jgi:hypothetical protein
MEMSKFERKQVEDKLTELDGKSVAEKITRGLRAALNTDKVVLLSRKVLNEEIGGDAGKITEFANQVKKTMEVLDDHLIKEQISHARGIMILEAIIHCVSQQMVRSSDELSKQMSMAAISGARH